MSGFEGRGNRFGLSWGSRFILSAPSPTILIFLPASVPDLWFRFGSGREGLSFHERSLGHSNSREIFLMNYFNLEV